ncbi:MAG: hypothetical protein KGQ46_00795 [Hyphomicrobiales bacterium]|nr:hypothetical protein [Hyphomicrobiales bacterium]MDE2114626.1 hypothetical protein [Hyphomicrobiales bacterium]
MKLLKAVLSEIFGLFVDDDRLALGVLAMVASLALALKTGLVPALAGPFLLIGCALLLIENVWRSVSAAQAQKAKGKRS